MKYWTGCRETGDFIEQFDTYHEATDAIMEYEEEDRKDGIYSEEFYSVMNDNHEEYRPSATAGDYSPSSPWNAPGMSVRDFI